MSITLLITTITVIGALAYHRVPLRFFAGALFVVLAAYSYWGNASYFILICGWLLYLIIMLPLNVPYLRRKFFSQKLFQLYCKVMPKMSLTEREALQAGTVSWEGELFNGKPRWQKLLQIPAPFLNTEEKAFLDGPVEQLCQMLNDWEVTHVRADLPLEIWQFIKSQGFFGLIIPKQYGGKGFSAFAHSEILAKVYSISITAATTISVPNSLGPAELLLHYGTEEQKNYYLPRLAQGEEIPCFALTEPEAGSDAGSITNTGIVCQEEFDGKKIIGIRLNWNKRYITLAPVATVLGLAFKLYDPDHLIGSGIEHGITCALIPTKTPGVKIGRRHFPLNTAFQNGPTQGQDVFIPLDWIIGGQKMIGQGWRMLVECLSAGRAISLPSSGIGGGKMAAMTTGAYARIRKQFNVAIGHFEGVAEALTRIAGKLYFIDAARMLTMAIIDQGAKPSVLSAIMKYHATEISRKIACDAMDVHGGKGICLGPRNYLGRFYQSLPISITVEGANILTRSLIIFGQGAIRCHRYVLNELEAAMDSDKARGLVLFDKALFGHIGLVISNIFRSFFLGITGAYFVKSPVSTIGVKRYYQLLTYFSAAFALLADFSMLVLGGELKRKERLSGRLGDVLSLMFITSAVLKRYEDQGRPSEDLPLVHWSCQDAFYLMQQQLDGILQNFPNKALRILLKVIIFPIGKYISPPCDRVGQQVADILLNPSVARERLIQGCFKGNILGQVEDTFNKVIAVEAVEAKVMKAQRAGVIKGNNWSSLIEAALTENIIDAISAEQLRIADKARYQIITVDDFAREELARGNQ